MLPMLFGLSLLLLAVSAHHTSVKMLPSGNLYFELRSFFALRRSFLGNPS